MDFCFEALNEIAAEVFKSLPHLLNLDLILIFVDITSTSWELGIADDFADLQDTVDDDDGMTRPAQWGKRAFGHSKDFRTDLPQMPTSPPHWSVRSLTTWNAIAAAASAPRNTWLAAVHSFFRFASYRHIEHARPSRRCWRSRRRTR